ncbi:ArsR/SmtB family transcription factor [Actinoplanes sp. CA-131856]
MRTFEHPERDELDLSRVLSALADPVRRHIVFRLFELSPKGCAEIEVPVSKSTATHHYRVLREAGLIRQHYQGTSIMNVLRMRDVETRFPGLLEAVIAAQRDAAPPS